MFNIITERFVRMTVADGVRSASLPEVFAALMTNEVETFPALRPVLSSYGTRVSDSPT